MNEQLSGGADPQIAVYIDFDNIVISRYDELHGRLAFRDDGAGRRYPTPLVKQRLMDARIDIGAIMDYAASFGTVAISRAYANWASPTNASYESDALRSSLDLVQMFPMAGTKNGADIRLAIDVIDDLSRYPYITHVLVVAGDSDYVALAQRCKRLGRRVVGVGAARSVGKYWEGACDEFKYYASVLTVTSVAEGVDLDETATQVPADESTAEPHAGGVPLVKAARLLHAKSATEWIAAAGLKTLLKRLDPGFDETADGFKSFTDFLLNYPDLLDVRSTDSGTMVHLRELGAATPGKLPLARPPVSPIQKLRRALGLGADRYVTADVEDLALRAVRISWELCDPDSPVVIDRLPVAAVRARLVEQGIDQDDARRAVQLALNNFPVLLRDSDMRLQPNPELTGASDEQLRQALHAGLVERVLMVEHTEVLTAAAILEAIHGVDGTPALLKEYEAILAVPGYRQVCQTIGPLLLAAPVLWDVAAAMVAVPDDVDLPSAEALGYLLDRPLAELGRSLESVPIDAAYLSLTAAGVIARGRDGHRSSMTGHPTEDVAAAVIKAWATRCSENGLLVVTEPFYRVALPDRFQIAWRAWVRQQIDPPS